MDISLSDSESRYYNDLFTLCDVEQTGKIQHLKALEFFRSSNVDNSVLSQVSVDETALNWQRAAVPQCRSQFSQCARQGMSNFWEGQLFFRTSGSFIS